MFNKLFNLFLTTSSGIQILIFILSILMGLIALIKGADLFVGGAKQLAIKLKVSSLVIGLTIVSFGTSAPETAVSVSSALNHSSGLSISNIIGSNIFNLLIVFGFSLFFLKYKMSSVLLKRDLPFMALSGVLLLIMSLFFGTNYTLLAIEGAILLLFFIIYLILSIKTSPSNEENEKSKSKLWLDLILICLGLVMIIGGAEFVTFGSKNLALRVGVSESLVGLTIVSIGTSLPELITSIVASKKGESGIAIGNVIGSNIFNILFILGLSVLMAPMNLDLNTIIDISIMVFIFILFLIYSLIKRNLYYKEGIVMVILYAIYLGYIIYREL